MAASKNKGKSVTITMHSKSAAGGAPDEIELITTGIMKKVTRDGVSGFQIAYDDTEATGFAGSRTIVSCFGDSLATMERTGQAESSLTIEHGKKHHCHYGTPYGDMLLGVFTHRIKNDLGDDGGELFLKYTIDINSAFVSDNEVHISVKVDQ
ncbi:MAG: DUF1934 domain-containing protein [Huintestinicola sp.]